MANVKQLTFNEEAKSKLFKGITTLYKAVTSTLGPQGRTVIIEPEYGPPHVTKDGVTVAKHIILEDPVENIGAQIIKQAAAKTASASGDGTTTATLLAYEMIKEGSKLPFDPIKVKRSFESIVESVIKSVESNSLDVTMENIEQIATISANNDSTIGKLIKEGYEFVGLDGVLTIEDSKSDKTTVTTVNGANVPSMTYLSPYFLTDKKKKEITYEDPIFLITDKKVRSTSEIVLAMEIAVAQKKPLIIIADELEAGALSLLVINRLHNNFPVAALRAPAYAERRAQILEDLCTLTGATLISNVSSRRLEDVTSADLGKAKKIIINDEGSIILNPAGSPEAIADRLEELSATLEDKDLTTYAQAKTLERMAFLKGKIAVINVGAATESEALEVKYRVDDSIRAVTSAIRKGYVVGGGMALFETANSLNDQDPIQRAMQKVLRAPLIKIIENAGLDPYEITSKIRELNSDNESMYKNTRNLIGYNASTHTFEKLFDAGVIDPTLVVTESLRNALSAASMILLTDTTMTKINREVYNPPHPSEDDF